MQSANWKQIKTALADAMELASETREEFVSSLDPEIGAQVRRDRFERGGLDYVRLVVAWDHMRETRAGTSS